MVKGKTIKSKDITTLLSGILIVIFVNILCNKFFFRIDLTEEKKYSINDATKKLLKNLDDQIYIEVFLEGDFPAGFKRLQKSIKETLEEFRIYAEDNIQYTFFDPNDFSDNKARNEFHHNLAEKGIQPTNLFANEDGKRVEKIMFPGALVRYGLKEIPVMLLKGTGGANAQEQLNASIENIEYNLANAIKKAYKSEKKKIAFTEGHNELQSVEMKDLINTLSEFHEVELVRLQSKINLDGYDLVIVAKPDTFFSEYDIFKLDQFIVKGGKAIFLIDPMRVNLDSIGENGTYSFPMELGLRDMLFKFGVRINTDLIQDYYCGMLPMFTGYVGNQPQTQMMPWRFYPVINLFSEHPISKNLGPVYAKFISTIDTVKAVGIKKTPLMYTSKNSKIYPAPVRLNFNDARIDVDPAMFNKGPIPVAYLLEGQFESYFANKLSQKSKDTFNFKEVDKPSKIIVFTDGDLIKNEVNWKNGATLPLGYDRWTGATFSNKDLIMNSIEYLLDETGLIQAKTKSIEIRPLDGERMKREKTKWQIINIVSPVVAIILFGFIWMATRKRKYQKFV